MVTPRSDNLTSKKACIQSIKPYTTNKSPKKSAVTSNTQQSKLANAALLREKKLADPELNILSFDEQAN